MYGVVAVLLLLLVAVGLPHEDEEDHGKGQDEAANLDHVLLLREAFGILTVVQEGNDEGDDADKGGKGCYCANDLGVLYVLHLLCGLAGQELLYYAKCFLLCLFQVVVDDYFVELRGEGQFVLGLGESLFNLFHAVGGTADETAA